MESENKHQMENLTVFVDEIGTFGFTKLEEPQERYYIVACVIIQTKLVDTFFEKYFELVSKIHQNDTMKYKDFKKKKEVEKEYFFKELQKMEFSTYFVVVDKKQLDDFKGLKYKTVFYKFFHDMAFRKIRNNINSLCFIVDDYGHKEFKDSFKNYLARKEQEVKSIHSLFPISTIEFLSKDEKVQIADILAGDFLEQIKSSKRINKDYQLNNKILNYILFPYKKYHTDSLHEDLKITKSSINSNIPEISLNSALKAFIMIDSEQNENESIEKYVLFLLIDNLLNNGDYLHSFKLVEFCNSAFTSEINRNFLKRTIINSLRRKGVLISSSAKGYKLPTSTQDIINYINKISENMLPAIKKLNDFVIEFSTALNVEPKAFYSSETMQLYKIFEYIKSSESEEFFNTP